jgi:hypothetical protein
MRSITFAIPLAVVGLLGCTEGKQADFPPLHPVNGVVKKDGKAVSGGTVQFTPDPDKPEFLTNSEVGTDGTFTLSTVRTTDKKGERKPGAPAGKYKVTYSPPLGDQTAGPAGVPIELPATVTVQSGDNNIPLELPKK